MFSSNAIIHNPKATLKLAAFLPFEQPVIVQIFGYDGELIAQAANIVQSKLHPAGIDINMGCPAPKITGNECGSGLLRNYDKALEIMKHVRANYTGQLSVKIRLGWAQNDVKQFVKQLYDIGIDAITIHGRTAKEGYKGLADWDAISDIAQDIPLPIIGNGDITTWQEAIIRAENANLMGVMIGRGALGNPWIFKEIKEHSEVNNKQLAVNPPTVISTRAEKSLSHNPKGSLQQGRDDKQELRRVIKKQAELSIKQLVDEKLAMRELRKHLGWYIKGFPGASELRKEAVQIDTYEDLGKVLEKLT